MTAAELARRVRSVELRARRTVGELVSGAYHSAFKGQGIEFQEVREYVAGDDTRTIDWNVTARVGRPYIKRFAEERDQTVMLLLDGSRSQSFGAAGAFKRDMAAEILAMLAFAAAYNKDETGLILFTGEVERYVPPAGGETHVLRLIRDVLAFQPRHRGTNLTRALEFLIKVRRRRSLVFVISDFQDRGFERQLRIAARRHDVIAVSSSRSARAEPARLRHDGVRGRRERREIPDRYQRRRRAARLAGRRRASAPKRCARRFAPPASTTCRSKPAAIMCAAC